MACTTVTSAADYRYEVDASYGDRDGTFTTVRSRALSGRYFFSSVDDSQGPLALAPFITRASSVTVFAADSESSFELPRPLFSSVMLSPEAAALLDGAYDIFPVDSILVGSIPAGDFAVLPVAFSGPESQSDRYGAAVEYVSDSAWIVRGELGASDATSSEFNIDRVEDGVSLELGVGRYVSDLLSVTLAYRYADSDTESTLGFFSCLPPAPCASSRVPYVVSKIKDRSWSVDARYLLPLEDVFHEFTATATYGVRSEDSRSLPTAVPLPIELPRSSGFNFDRWQLTGGYTFYPRRDWRVGVQLSHLDFEREELQTYTVRGSWFVTPAIAVGGAYSRSNTDSDTFAIGVEDIDGFELSLAGRF